jgi:endonuclease/exonuclease/phosphatase (EEP) superfamily protein YafD
LRLLHWNVAGGWVGAAEQAAEIAARSPDVVVLSEGPERVARNVGAALPGFRSRSLGALSVLAREPGEGVWLERRRELQAIEIPVRWNGADVRLMVVNLASSPRVHRDPWLRRVLALADERRPDLVVGDFNAPRRSRALSRLPEGWRHAYLEAGRGWSASFPVPLPLWSLDHVLVGPGWRALDYRLVSTRWSDHRLQWSELARAAPPPAAAAGAALSGRSSSPGASPGTP